ncbi:MAG: hypothetical protein JXA00_05930 [Candidatus Thermoplasmatota archaeon]|nr:hypothetical protein [Candidatus Thermoplasmatota archaeon]
MVLANEVMTLKRSLRFIAYLLLLTSLLMLCSSNQAYQDGRTSVFFYVTWMQQDGSWHDWVNVTNTTLKDITLAVGQSLKCMLVGTSREPALVSFHLYEPCPEDYYSFDVVEGNGHDEVYAYDIRSPEFEWSQVPPEYRCRQRLINETFTYTWVLAANNRWTNARSPLNCYYFISYSVEECIDRQQTLMLPYISDELWIGPCYTSANETGTTKSVESPAGGLLGVVLSILLALIVYENVRKTGRS